MPETPVSFQPGAERRRPEAEDVPLSVLYTLSEAHREAAESSRAAYQDRLTAAGYGRITTEIADAPPFYYAEDYHQQYLAKNPGGYCGIGGTGVACSIGTGA